MQERIIVNNNKNVSLNDNFDYRVMYGNSRINSSHASNNIIHSKHHPFTKSWEWEQCCCYHIE